MSVRTAKTGRGIRATGAVARTRAAWPWGLRCLGLRLQNARPLLQGAPSQTLSLKKWIAAAIRIMWVKAGEFLDSVSKWHTYAE